MEGSLAKELYSSVENLRLSDVELEPKSISNISDCDGDNEWHDDSSLWGDSSDEFERPNDSNRDMQKMQNQFHTIGYRDGLIAGKEAAAQEGFNIGFKQSVLVGYKWGLVRGVTSVLESLESLSDELKEKLVETEEKRRKFQCLHESVHSLSTTDAIKLFGDDILRNRSTEQSEKAETGSHGSSSVQDPSTECGLLVSSFEELQSLVVQSPALEFDLAIEQRKL